MASTLRMLFDPDTDVVRVFTDGECQKCVAVPLEDLTILVSPALDRVVGIDIQDLPSFVERYVSSKLIPSHAEGEELFAASERHLRALMDFYTRNVGPTAKDQVARWDEFVSRQIQAAH